MTTAGGQQMKSLNRGSDLRADSRRSGTCDSALGHGNKPQSEIPAAELTTAS